MGLERESWVFSRERERDFHLILEIFCREREILEYFIERENLENMSWVRLLTEVNMSLSYNVVFSYQESFKKIKKVMQTIFPNL